MTRYQLIHPEYSGHLAFYYDNSGVLREFQVNSPDITAEQLARAIKGLRLCLTDGGLMAVATEYKYRVQKTEIDLSYQRFSDMYGICRDRHKCEPLWNRLKPDERYNILLNLKAYRNYCRKNPKYIQMMPKTYLAGAYTNDWDKLPAFSYEKK